MKKRVLLFFFCALYTALVIVTAQPVYANSAQSHWEGVDSRGCVVVGEDCPVVVTSEVLTFEIPELPKSHYSGYEEFSSYSASVTAEYTFYNPSDYTVTAKLAFPFGNPAEYGEYLVDDNGDQIADASLDTSKYAITVNGEAVSRTVRYSLNTSSRFEVTHELLKLSDEYLADPFFTPSATVTKYTYVVGGEHKEGQIDSFTYPKAYVAFDWSGGEGRSRVFSPGCTYNYTLTDDGDVRFSKRAENGDVINVFVIGEPPSSPPAFTCYEDSRVNDDGVIGGVVSLVSSETLTFEELALLNYSEASGVSRVDWYNAVLCAFNNDYADSREHGYVYSFVGYDAISSYLSPLMSAEDFVKHLMRWYEYEITFLPGESASNSVSAPIYPAINMDYEPPIYEYTYLLSPASTWADFKNLQVIIHTPYFITDNSLDGFVRTQDGYVASFDALPEEELQFTLCEDDSPEYDSGITVKDVVTVALICAAGLASAAVASFVLRRIFR